MLTFIRERNAKFQLEVSEEDVTFSHASSPFPESYCRVAHEPQVKLDFKQNEVDLCVLTWKNLQDIERKKEIVENNAHVVILPVFRNTHTCKSNSLGKRALSKTVLGFLSGLVVKNPPANAGDTWFNPWSGKSPHDPIQLSLCTIIEPVLWSPGTATIEAPTEAP